MTFVVRTIRSPFDVRRSCDRSRCKGTIVDYSCGVVVDKFEDLDAWQVGDELRIEVYALTATGPASHDFKFCNQIRDAASSVTRNISEGFGRFYPGDFAHFMDFSIGSVMEIQDALRDGVGRNHFTADQVRKAQTLAVRSLQVSKGLKRYLQSARRHPRWNSRRTSNDSASKRTTNDSGSTTKQSRTTDERRTIAEPSERRTTRPSHLRFRMFSAAFRPGAPMIPPPGWAPEPHIQRLRIGVVYWAHPGAGRRKKSCSSVSSP